MQFDIESLAELGELVYQLNNRGQGSPDPTCDTAVAFHPSALGRFNSMLCAPFHRHDSLHPDAVSRIATAIVRG